MIRHSLVVVLLSTIATSATAQVVVSGLGVDPASITAARDSFRTNLGGGTVAGANGSFGGVRREINWDGVPATQSAPNSFAANFFNTTSPRGAVFATPGTGFQVSGATTDAGAGQPAAPNFGNIDPTYTTTFQQFSAQRLFSPLGSNITDVNFFVPGSATAALTNGFGAVFTDVDTANTTMQFFNASNSSLGTFSVPISPSGGLSFLGVSFPTSVVSRVRIITGNTAIDAGGVALVTDKTAPRRGKAAVVAGILDGGATDLVVMDDFIYGEPLDPVVVPTVPVWMLLALTTAIGVVGVTRLRRA